MMRFAAADGALNPDECLLFVKYDQRYLNILDVEKPALILKSPV